MQRLLMLLVDVNNADTREWRRTFNEELVTIASEELGSLDRKSRNSSDANGSKASNGADNGRETHG
jgi:hypothetical protein